MSAEAGPAMNGGSDEHVRRVRLPADRRTPAAARALVRSVLAEADLHELLNEALLLTTELTTNAVEHARTELDIEVEADPAGLTVTVTDFASGRSTNCSSASGTPPPTSPRSPSADAGCCWSTTSPAGGAPPTCPPGRASGSGSTDPVRGRPPGPPA
ncbi:hypothetical protein Nm8I071_00470 [Nonomuraea sp. TT08I-71]|nr:hypothetical protein Nm8I071_00470 [Nonomuraea sp. TT08I-71]